MNKYRKLLEKAAPFVGWASTRAKIVAGVRAEDLCDEIDAALAAEDGMTAEQEEAMKRQQEITSALWKMPSDMPISEKLSLASNTLFLTCRNEGLPEREMITALALASGFACGVMADAAQTLKELGQ